MSVIYTENSNKFAREVAKIHNKRVGNRTSKKLYTSNTDDFEPTQNNRNHLINTMLPMVMSIAKTHAKKYGARIEYDDCVSAGMLGATLATDIYIKRSEVSSQSAKLSTFAHYYITKYILEYCRDSVSILSYGPTQYKQATEMKVYEGDSTYEESNESFFDASGEQALMLHTTENMLRINESTYIAKKMMNKALSYLPHLNAVVMTLFFGLNDTKPVDATDIANQFNLKAADVNTIIDDSIDCIKNACESDKELQSMYAFLNK